MRGSEQEAVVSARSGIMTLAALAPVITGCGMAAHLMPGGPRYGRVGVSDVDSCLLPADAELSCAAFAVEGSAASPPVFVDEVFTGEVEPEALPLTAPGSDATSDPDRSILEAPPTSEPGHSILQPPSMTEAAGYEMPAPVIVETEEDARRALALEAASLASSPRRSSSDVAVGPLRDPIEHNPPPMPSQEFDVPLVPPARRLVESAGPVRADYVNAPLAKVASALHLPHRRLGDGVLMRPGLIAGLHGRIAAHREPPEPVPFVVYERVAPRFLPVPTRPAFEPATATYASLSAPGTKPSISIRPPLGVTPDPFAPPKAPTNGDSNAAPSEEALPRPLPSMEALPLPQPGVELPPAPRIDDF